MSEHGRSLPAGPPTRGTASATRRRILEAALAAWESVGPSRTSVSAVAETAGVQRLTVYRHFPEPDRLVEAVFDASGDRLLGPDPERWRRIADPAERLRVGLGELYEHYAAHDALIARLERDEATLPDAARARLADVRGRIVAALVEDRPHRAVRGRRVEAAVAVATAFGTWRMLVRERGLGSEEAVDLMTGLVARS